MSKKTNAPVFTLKVKNNILGRFFIKALRARLNNKRYFLVLRGRHSNRKKLYSKLNLQYRPGTQNEVPLKHSETIGIYIKEKPQYVNTPGLTEYRERKKQIIPKLEHVRDGLQ